ncbi:MAG: serine/threonine protein kinase [Cyanobacteriota bacterium]
MRSPVEPYGEPPPAELLWRIERQLLPQLRLRSVDPHDPIRVLSLPQPWRPLGCGNYAAVLHHPDHPELVVKVYAPGRPGLEQEAEVYRRLGFHPAFSQCLHRGDGYLVLRRGIPIPLQAIQDIDAGLAHAVSRGLHGHDMHGRNLMLHRGRGLIVDISDFLNPAPCRAWQDLRWAYHWLYRPLIAPLALRAPAPLLNGLRKGYRLYRRLAPAKLQAP